MSTSGAIRRRTPTIGLSELNFDAPNWGDEQNANMRTLDGAIRVLGAGFDGVWENVRHYIVGMTVVDSDDGSVWRVRETHDSPSTGSFEDYRIAEPDHWEEVANIVTFRGTWQPDVAYQRNDIVFQGTLWGIVKENHVSEGSLADEITRGNTVLFFDGPAVEAVMQQYQDDAEVARDASQASADNSETSATNSQTSASASAGSAASSADSASLATGRAAFALEQANRAEAEAATATDRASVATAQATTATTMRNQTEGLRDATQALATAAAGSASDADDSAQFANNRAGFASSEADRAKAAADSIAAGPVTSVNTQTGVVVLTKADIGLGNVVDLAPEDMPVSDATSLALSDMADNLGSEITNNVNASTALERNKRYRIVATSAITLTLPADPIAGDTIRIIDGESITDMRRHTVARNGRTIMGQADNLVLDVPGISVMLWYNGTTWRLY